MDQHKKEQTIYTDWHACILESHLALCIPGLEIVVQAVTNRSKVEAGRRKGGEVRTTSASVVGAVSGGPHTRQTANDRSSPPEEELLLLWIKLKVESLGW